MVLDTSALLALLLDEPEAEEYRTAVEEDATRLVSAATLLEAALVIEARKGEPGGLAYAVARTSGEPLLFKGAAFAKTDVSRVS
jgi:ribonuclease VapC